MNSPTQPPSPMTAMLKGQIEAGKARLLAGGGNGHDGFLLFSSPQEAMPKLVFLDPILDPAEKTVFANIWIHAKEQGIQMAGFPSHRILMSRCNIRRRQAIARSMTILRLLRWITLCETVQEPGTRVFRGNIYALHDEPATLALVQELDAGYLGYLEQCRHSPDPRVRDIATRVTAGIDAEIASGHDPTKHDPVRAQNARLEALEAIRMLEQDPQAGESPVAFFGVPVAPVSPKPGEENYQVQNPNMVISSVVVVVDIYIKKLLLHRLWINRDRKTAPRSSSHRKSRTRSSPLPCTECGISRWSSNRTCSTSWGSRSA